MFCFRQKKSKWLHRVYSIVLVRDFFLVFYSNKRIECLGRIGIGLAVAGGVINSMLYNGNKLDENFVNKKFRNIF